MYWPQNPADQMCILPWKYNTKKNDFTEAHSIKGFNILLSSNIALLCGVTQWADESWVTSQALRNAKNRCQY